ncbi:MAG: hypothetical protein HFG26_13485 [Provencibacterium sp.]|jgi:hypothetical protein|nr:hypothetical protein [Provencibacterium sp.]
MKVKEILHAVKEKAPVRMLAMSATGAAALVGTAVPAFAAVGDELPTIAITTEMLTPLVEGVVANVGVILPVGLGLFAIMLGIRIIPVLIKRFVG